jgi:hypothetical protein
MTTASHEQQMTESDRTIGEVAFADRADPASSHGQQIELTIGEAIALVGVTLVASVATWSLALAQLGKHDGWSAVGIGLVTTLALAGVACALGGRLRVRLEWAELAMLGAVLAVGAFFFFPGFHYAWNDKDPGVYVLHGFAIARDGDVYIDDEVVQHGITPAYDSSGRLPGLWTNADHPGQVTGQFYHLYSSLLATADDLGGARAVFNLNPLLALGSVGLIVLAARRAAGTLVAGLAGALLVTSMMQVWQARYPSTEIPAQLFLAGTLLGAILAIRCRWAGGAFVAGTLVGVGFLARPDGFLYVVLATSLVALAIAVDHADRRVTSFVVGLMLTFPYALWNAYVAREDYSSSSDVPGLAELLAALVAIVAAGYAGRAVLHAIRARRPAAALANPDRFIDRWYLPLGVIACIGMGTALLLLFFRPEIWGEHFKPSYFTGEIERSFDEINMKWLSWFVTVRGLAIMFIGFCVVMLRRWRASLWVLVVPGALLLPLYLYNARVSMRLMWWVRRFIPAVVPAVVLLIAIALAWALTRRSFVVKVGGAVAALSLIVEYTGMSLPLRDHDEMAGSWDISAAIASTAGDEEGVFLFPSGTNLYSINRNAPGAVWLLFDQISARLPDGYDLAMVEQYQSAFPEQPVYVVTPGAALPEQLPTDRFTMANVVTGEVTVWKETRDYRPEEQEVFPMGVTVWQLIGSAATTPSPGTAS